MTDHFTTVNNMIGALKSDDAEERLNSVRGLHVIAATLGPDRVKAELLPFLTDYLDESDDVLREFAAVLAGMVAEVGGIQHVNHIVTPLETLCSLEDVTVRDEAVSSLCRVGDQIFKEGTAAQQNDYVQLVLGMSKSPSPQTRYSAATLLTVPYGQPSMLASTKLQLRDAFCKLCGDEEIMVRRGAVVALGEKFAKALGDNCAEMLPAFLSSCRDPNDGIRLQCVPTAVAVLPRLTDGGATQVAAAYKLLAADAMWRVRYMAADKLPDAARYFPPADAKSAFEILRRLLEDPEPEIRASAAFHLHEVLALSSDNVAKRNALTLATALIDDVNAHVRTSIASSLLRCAHFVPKEMWSTTIVNGCARLLKDSESDVRLAIISSFGAIGGTPEGKDIAPKLVGAVINLASDAKWRVRETVVQQLPALIANLTHNADEVLGVCLEALADRVATIREAACQSCYQLVKLQGMAWAKSTLFPKIMPLSQQQNPQDLPDDETVSAAHNYLRRVTFLHLLQTLLPLFESSTLTTVFWPAMSQLISDSTANVRINAARTLVMAQRDGKAGSGKEVAAALTKLSSDADQDVKEEATRTL